MYRNLCIWLQCYIMKFIVHFVIFFLPIALVLSLSPPCCIANAVTSFEINKILNSSVLDCFNLLSDLQLHSTVHVHVSTHLILFILQIHINIHNKTIQYHADVSHLFVLCIRSPEQLQKFLSGKKKHPLHVHMSIFFFFLLFIPWFCYLMSLGVFT